LASFAYSGLSRVKPSKKKLRESIDLSSPIYSQWLGRRLFPSLEDPSSMINQLKIDLRKFIIVEIGMVAENLIKVSTEDIITSKQLWRQP